jgi:hypothetical protein
MEKAILIARENAKLTSDEIVHLRQQLIIGGSTWTAYYQLRLAYMRQNQKKLSFLLKSINLQVLIVSSLGLLSGALGFNV